MLTAFFKANAKYPEARNLLFQDMPSTFVWNQKKREWTLRVNPGMTGAVGRMYAAHPTSGERFYLCLLLTSVRGSTSFEALCSFQGVTYNTFKEACFARGLLEDDREWAACLEEASLMATGTQLRHLFTVLLRECQPQDPLQLWNR
jgi:hypothetical protein